MAETTVNILWLSLLDNDQPQSKFNITQKPQQTTQSFSKILNNVCDKSLSQLPKPCLKGDRLAILTTKEEYLACLEACKHNLHERII